MANRVFITGIGAITPIGVGRSDLWDGARGGRRAVQAVDRFDATAFRSKVAGQVNGFDPAALLQRKEAQRTDRFSQFSIAAAQLAFDDASYAPKRGDGDFGVWIGTALGGVAYAEQQYAAYYERGITARLHVATLRSTSACTVRPYQIQIPAPRGPSRSATRFARSAMVSAMRRSPVALRRRWHR